MKFKTVYIQPADYSEGLLSSDAKLVASNSYSQIIIHCSHSAQISKEGIGNLIKKMSSVIGASGGMLWFGEEMDEHACLWYDISGKVLQTVSFVNHSVKLTVHENSIIELGESIRIKATRDEQLQFSEGRVGAYHIQNNEVVISDGGGIEFNALVESGIIPYIGYFIEKEDKSVISLRANVFDSSAGSNGRLFFIQFHPSSSDPSLSKTILESNAPRQSAFRTPLGAPLYLTMIAKESGYVSVYDPVKQEAYYTPSGNWIISRGEVNNNNQEPIRLLCGISGLEFIEQTAENAIINFDPTRGAYAPYQGDQRGARVFLTSSDPGSIYPVNTAWVSFPAAGTGYYSQPASSPLYCVDDSFSSEQFLKFFEIKSVEVNVPAVKTFPLMPYQGTNTSDKDQFELLEKYVLSPCRRDIIIGVASFEALHMTGPRSLSMQQETHLFSTTGPTGGTGNSPVCPTGPYYGPTGPLGPTASFVSAVTPQGLLAEFDEVSAAWETLTLAHSADTYQTLIITDIRDTLRAALLTNQLFLVISSYNKFEQYDWFSVQFKVTASSMDEMKAAGVPGCVLKPLAGILDRLYFSKDYFTQSLLNLLGHEPYEAYKDLILRYTSAATLVIGEWEFDLAPYYWHYHDTIMILKFSDLSLKELVADTGLWTMGNIFNDDVNETQMVLRAIIEDAEKKIDAGEKDFEYFFYTVINNKSGYGGDIQIWNGPLFLNASVPLNQLPQQLQGLASGINKDKFFAHHIGASVSNIASITGQTINTSDTSLFGLISYSDPDDLIYSGKPYAYKVLSLKVLFSNSQISNFSSKVELLVGELYNELVTLPGGLHGNNIILNGTYQKHGMQKSYLFIEESDNLFEVQSKVLDVVEINKVQFVTVLDEKTEISDTKVHARFILWGSMRFLELDDFDLFSFGKDENGFKGKLSYSNLAINMTFDKATQGDIQFEFDSTQQSFDISQSKARPNSLYARFPLTVSSMVQGLPNEDKAGKKYDVRLVNSHEELKYFLYPGRTMAALEANQAVTGESPASLGYISVLSQPLKQSKLTSPWFGLVFDINFGSPGGLASKLNFSASFIAAWSPSKDQYEIFTGIKLPGSSGGNPELTIMGPLKLKMDHITLMRTPDEAFIMRFFNIALSLLGVSFPSGGRTNALLFGDPDKKSNSSLGWYAAYKKDEEKKDKGKTGELNRLITQNQ